MTLVSDMGEAIIALGYGTSYYVDVLPFRFPLSPINCIVVIPLGGSVPDEVQGSNDGIDYPGFQVQVRNEDIDLASMNAEAIRLGLNGSTVGDYTIFTTRSSPTNVTSDIDLNSSEPAHRFAVDFITIKVR